MNYFVKCLIYNNKKWNHELKQYETTEPYLYNPCGTDYSFIFRDLKTLKGVKNRLKKFSLRKDIVKLQIFTYTNIFNDDTFRLLEEIPINQLKEII
jgi:hypothetical protein